MPQSKPAYSKHNLETAEAALSAVRESLLAIPAQVVEPFRLNHDRAIRGLLGVLASAEALELKARLRPVPKSLFDLEQLERLTTLVWAAWFVQRQLQTASASARTMAVPATLLVEAQRLEQRMQACCEYYLGDHPEVGPEVLALRTGTGYMDLVQDLQGYARLYQTHIALIASDKKHYRASDATQAQELANQLLTHLTRRSGTGELESLLDLRDRIWTLLVPTYEDVAATARWVFRKSPGSTEAFKSVYQLGRAPRTRSVEWDAPDRDDTTPG